jgi:EAL and modified HD-GYP domain-containing signal transduction protein
MTDVYVGRQPIFDKNLKVFAYELLYRSRTHSNPAAAGITGDQATTEIIVNGFMEIGLDRLVGHKLAAINLTENFLLGDNKLPFSPKQVILEILEDVRVTPELVEAVSRLSKSGYIIALDDYIFNPEHEPLLNLAKIVKIDLMALTSKELEQHVKILRQFNVELVAEKVETPEEFIHCRDLGFDYFQGYFLSRPQIIPGESLPANRLAVLNLLAVLQDPNAEADDLADAINADVTTSYKLLKLLNSAAFNLPRKIDSIQQGVLLLGRRKLASWASMLALSTMNDRPTEMIHAAMARAKMCEQLAERASLASSETFFTVGLFSALEVLMQRPLTKLIEPLPLSDDVVAALLYREGILGEALSCALAYEMADWDKVKFVALGSEDILIANVEAVTWANGILDNSLS